MELIKIGTIDPKVLAATGKKWAKRVALFILALVLFLESVGSVPAGNRGVRLQFGAVQPSIVAEGLYFKIPFVQSVVRMDVQIQKEQVDVNAASKDLQTVTSVVALNFHINPEYVSEMYRTVGTDYKSRIIDPAIQESVKASTAKFTAEELITKREDVRNEVELLMTEKLGTMGIVVDELNIVDFDFSEAFNGAIEAKVTAEQNALAAQNKLEQVKFEAQQAIEEAAGKAEAIRIEGEALSSNPDVVMLRWIERWNGVTPLYWGGATPFIGIGK